MQIYPSEITSSLAGEAEASSGGDQLAEEYPARLIRLRPFGVPTRTMAAAVVNRFPPDPAEPRLGKQLLLLCRRCYCFGAGGLATTQSSVTWLFDHDPANECLVTGLFRIALAQRSKNTV